MLFFRLLFRYNIHELVKTFIPFEETGTCATKMKFTDRFYLYNNAFSRLFRDNLYELVEFFFPVTRKKFEHVIKMNSLIVLFKKSIILLPFIWMLHTPQLRLNSPVTLNARPESVSTTWDNLQRWKRNEPTTKCIEMDGCVLLPLR